MRKIIFLLLTIVMAFVGCKKEEIVTVTNYTGRVIEGSTLSPLQGVKVAVTNGSRVHVSDITDAQGGFKFTVDFEKIQDGQLV